MIRAFGKTLYGCAFTWGGLSRLRPGPDPRRMPFIVGYHRVVEDFSRSVRHAIPPMLTSAAMLERHLDCLGKQFEFVSLDDIGVHLENGRPFRKPAAAITFDDGYSDVYWHAFPILKRKGIPAAIFLVTDLVGSKRLQFYDKLYLLISRVAERQECFIKLLSRVLDQIGAPCPELSNLGRSTDLPFRAMALLMSRFPQSVIQVLIAHLEQSAPLAPALIEELAPLNWSMVAEMYESGITIGSHTLTHALLTQETMARVECELASSKQTIETKVHSTVKHFAYPDGRFNPEVVEAVQAAGYCYAYGICRTRDPKHPLLTIPRKVLWEKACVNSRGDFSSLIMHCQSRWAFDPNHRCEHYHAIGREPQTCQARLNIA